MCYCPTKKHLEQATDKLSKLFTLLRKQAKTPDAAVRIQKRHERMLTIAKSMVCSSSNNCYDEQLHMLEDLCDALSVAKSNNDEVLADASEEQLEMVNYWNERLASSTDQPITQDSVTVKDVVHFKRWTMLNR